MIFETFVRVLLYKNMAKDDCSATSFTRQSGWTSNAVTGRFVGDVLSWECYDRLRGFLPVD